MTSAAEAVIALPPAGDPQERLAIARALWPVSSADQVLGVLGVGRDALEGHSWEPTRGDARSAEGGDARSVPTFAVTPEGLSRAIAATPLVLAGLAAPASPDGKESETPAAVDLILSRLLVLVLLAVHDAESSAARSIGSQSRRWLAQVVETALDGRSDNCPPLRRTALEELWRHLAVAVVEQLPTLTKLVSSDRFGDGGEMALQCIEWHLFTLRCWSVPSGTPREQFAMLNAPQSDGTPASGPASVSCRLSVASGTAHAPGLVEVATSAFRTLTRSSSARLRLLSLSQLSGMVGDEEMVLAAQHFAGGTERAVDACQAAELLTCMSVSRAGRLSLLVRHEDAAQTGQMAADPLSLSSFGRALLWDGLAGKLDARAEGGCLRHSSGLRKLCQQLILDMLREEGASSVEGTRAVQEEAREAEKAKREADGASKKAAKRAKRRGACKPANLLEDVIQAWMQMFQILDSLDDYSSHSAKNAFSSFRKLVASASSQRRSREECDDGPSDCTLREQTQYWLTIPVRGWLLHENEAVARFVHRELMADSALLIGACTPSVVCTLVDVLEDGVAGASRGPAAECSAEKEGEENALLIADGSSSSGETAVVEAIAKFVAVRRCGLAFLESLASKPRRFTNVRVALRILETALRQALHDASVADVMSAGADESCPKAAELLLRVCATSIQTAPRIARDKLFGTVLTIVGLMGQECSAECGLEVPHVLMLAHCSEAALGAHCGRSGASSQAALAPGMTVDVARLCLVGLCTERQDRRAGVGVGPTSLADGLIELCHSVGVHQGSLDLAAGLARTMFQFDAREVSVVARELLDMSARLAASAAAFPAGSAGEPYWHALTALRHLPRAALDVAFGSVTEGSPDETKAGRAAAALQSGLQSRLKRLASCGSDSCDVLTDIAVGGAESALLNVLLDTEKQLEVCSLAANVILVAHPLTSALTTPPEYTAASAVATLVLSRLVPAVPAGEKGQPLWDQMADVRGLVAGALARVWHARVPGGLGGGGLCAADVTLSAADEGHADDTCTGPGAVADLSPVEASSLALAHDQHSQWTTFAGLCSNSSLASPPARLGERRNLVMLLAAARAGASRALGVDGITALCERLQTGPGAASRSCSSWVAGARRAHSMLVEAFETSNSPECKHYADLLCALWQSVEARAVVEAEALDLPRSLPHGSLAALLLVAPADQLHFGATEQSQDDLSQAGTFSAILNSAAGLIVDGDSVEGTVLQAVGRLLAQPLMLALELAHAAGAAGSRAQRLAALADSLSQPGAPPQLVRLGEALNEADASRSIHSLVGRVVGCKSLGVARLVVRPLAASLQYVCMRRGDQDASGGLLLLLAFTPLLLELVAVREYCVPDGGSYYLGDGLIEDLVLPEPESAASLTETEAAMSHRLRELTRSSGYSRVLVLQLLSELAAKREFSRFLIVFAKQLLEMLLLVQAEINGVRSGKSLQGRNDGVAAAFLLRLADESACVERVAAEVAPEVGVLSERAEALESWRAHADDLLASPTAHGTGAQQHTGKMEVARAAIRGGKTRREVMQYLHFTPLPLSYLHRLQLRLWGALAALAPQVTCEPATAMGSALALSVAKLMRAHLSLPSLPDVRDMQELVCCSLLRSVGDPPHASEAGTASPSDAPSEPWGTLGDVMFCELQRLAGDCEESAIQVASSTCLLTAYALSQLLQKQTQAKEAGLCSAIVLAPGVSEASAFLLQSLLVSLAQSAAPIRSMAQFALHEIFERRPLEGSKCPEGTQTAIDRDVDRKARDEETAAMLGVPKGDCGLLLALLRFVRLNGDAAKIRRRMFPVFKKWNPAARVGLHVLTCHSLASDRAAEVGHGQLLTAADAGGDEDVCCSQVEKREGPARVAGLDGKHDKVKVSELELDEFDRRNSAEHAPSGFKHLRESGSLLYCPEEHEFLPTHVFMASLKESVQSEMTALFDREEDPTVWGSRSYLQSWWTTVGGKLRVRRDGVLDPAEHLLVTHGVSSNKVVAPADEGADEPASSENLQRKFLPADALGSAATAGGALALTPAKRRRVIMVASLVDRPPNLGGLARTCEIFHCRELAVPSLALCEDPQFVKVAVTADKHCPMVETPTKAKMVEYLRRLKFDEGYTLVALEQTHQSVCLSKAVFPEKTAIVLGAEREGMPPDLLGLVDMCVEIPQSGQIRSLNVHVSASLALWSYVQQWL